MRMKSKRLALLIGISLAVFTLSIFPMMTDAAKAASAPYKLGLVTSVTGFMSPMGSGARDVAKLVVHENND